MNSTVTYEELDIPLGKISTIGHLRHMPNSKGIILFSHGSGSSRLSTRNNYVADFLMSRGFSSLLFDLLTSKEDIFYENRFDIQLLTTRLINATEWVKNYDITKNLHIGYFGASTGAASALNAAAQLGNSIEAVVSRGGRPDLAIAVLPYIKTPVLLLVGSKDDVVIGLNEKAKNKIPGICELKIIEGATHLFPEPGKLDIVSDLTSNWFDKYL